MLAGEIAQRNAAAAGTVPDPHGRRDFGLGPLAPPYYIGRVVPGLFHTQGGLRVDADARVLRQDGAPVPNLFAGGGAAAGISGRAGALGYASGNGLLSAIALGRLAALAAARELGARRDARPRPRRRVRALSRNGLPPEVAATARLHLLDAIGVGLASAGSEAGAPYRRYAAGLGPGSASLIGIPAVSRRPRRPSSTAD